MILIAEPVHFSDTHVQVNSAFVALFQKVCEGEKILLVAEEKHIEAIKNNAGDLLGNVGTKSFKNYNKNGKHFFWYRKIIGEWLQILKVFRAAKAQKPEMLVWLSLFPTGHLLVNIISRLFYKKQKQWIILHAELGYLAGAKKKSERCLSYILKKSFSLVGNNTRYIVLGQAIKDKAAKILPVIQNKFHAIPHPYLYTDIQERKFTYPLKICIFGALNKAKNAHLFFELAASFQKEIEDEKLSFCTLGKLSEELKPFSNKWVDSYKPDEFLPQKEFEQVLSKNDIAVFFYDQNQYSLGASGALHEAMNLGMQVIALENEYFRSVDNGTGLINLVPDITSLRSEIDKFLNNTQSEFLSSQKRLIMFLQQNSFLLQSERLRNLLYLEALEKQFS